MIKCTKGQVRQLKTALRWKIPPEQRQRIQMVLLRESGMTQPLIAAAMGVSLSTVNRAHMTYDHGGIKALKPRPSGGRKRENMTLEEEKGVSAAQVFVEFYECASMAMPTVAPTTTAIAIISQKITRRVRIPRIARCV